jgi:DNA-binding MarR family transcriptional regulator
MSSGWVRLVWMNETTQWLSRTEQQAWRTFVRLHQRLTAALSRDLQTQAKLSGADFEILVALTDVPEGRLRPQDLAKAIDWEQSRLSHQIARMTRRDLVAREECTEDGRGVVVAITPTGREVIEAAAPKHVATVRRLVIDALDPDDLATLERIYGRLLERLDHEAT